MILPEVSGPTGKFALQQEIATAAAGKKKNKGKPRRPRHIGESDRCSFGHVEQLGAAESLIKGAKLHLMPGPEGSAPDEQIEYDQRNRRDLPVPTGHVQLPASWKNATGSSVSAIFAREFDVTLRALRFYQSQGLPTPGRDGNTRQFTAEDCERLTVVLQGKRLGFTP